MTLRRSPQTTAVGFDISTHRWKQFATFEDAQSWQFEQGQLSARFVYALSGSQPQPLSEPLYDKAKEELVEYLQEHAGNYREVVKDFQKGAVKDADYAASDVYRDALMIFENALEIVTEMGREAPGRRR